VIRTRETADLPDGIGWCAYCRCYVECGHHCGEEVAPAATAGPTSAYDPDRDGPF
jgi:hypothetical protein